MFNKYSKILAVLFIVILFFVVSVVAVSVRADDGSTSSAHFSDGYNGRNGDGGHNGDNSCDWGHYDSRFCPPRQGDCDDKNRDHDGKCPVTPPPTCPTNCGYQGGSIPDGHGKTISCDAMPACVTAAPAPVTGGPGDGRSDGLGCGSHDCSGNPQPSNQAVLGAATGPQVLGLSYTSGEESFLPQLIQIFGAITSGGLGFIFLKKNG